MSLLACISNVKQTTANTCIRERGRYIMDTEDMQAIPPAPGPLIQDLAPVTLEDLQAVRIRMHHRWQRREEHRRTRLLPHFATVASAVPSPPSNPSPPAIRSSELEPSPAPGHLRPLGALNSPSPMPIPTPNPFSFPPPPWVSQPAEPTVVPEVSVPAEEEMAVDAPVE